MQHQKKSNNQHESLNDQCLARISNRETSTVNPHVKQGTTNSKQRQSTFHKQGTTKNNKDINDNSGLMQGSRPTTTDKLVVNSDVTSQWSIMVNKQSRQGQDLNRQQHQGGRAAQRVRGHHCRQGTLQQQQFQTHNQLTQA
jgi:hypothetical protein